MNTYRTSLAEFTPAINIWTICVLAFMVYLGYCSYSERRAEKQAQQFCESIKEGDATDNLLQRALASGADSQVTVWNKGEGRADWLPVTFVGPPPFSRHLCSVYASDGKILRAQIRHID